MPVLRVVRARSLAVNELGQAEVEHLDEGGVVAARDEEDVLGLEVAVDDAVRVRGRERVGDLRGDRDGALGLEAAPRA